MTLMSHQERWLRIVGPGREIKPLKKDLENSQRVHGRKIIFKLGD